MVKLFGILPVFEILGHLPVLNVYYIFFMLFYYNLCTFLIFMSCNLILRCLTFLKLLSFYYFGIKIHLPVLNFFFTYQCKCIVCERHDRLIE